MNAAMTHRWSSQTKKNNSLRSCDSVIRYPSDPLISSSDTSDASDVPGKKPSIRRRAKGHFKDALLASPFSTRKLEETKRDKIAESSDPWTRPSDESIKGICTTPQYGLWNAVRHRKTSDATPSHSAVRRASRARQHLRDQGSIELDEQLRIAFNNKRKNAFPSYTAPPKIKFDNTAHANTTKASRTMKRFQIMTGWHFEFENRDVTLIDEREMGELERTTDEVLPLESSVVAESSLDLDDFYNRTDDYSDPSYSVDDLDTPYDGDGEDLLRYNYKTYMDAYVRLRTVPPGGKIKSSVPREGKVFSVTDELFQPPRVKVRSDLEAIKKSQDIKERFDASQKKQRSDEMKQKGKKVAFKMDANKIFLYPMSYPTDEHSDSSIRENDIHVVNTTTTG